MVDYVKQSMTFFETRESTDSSNLDKSKKGMRKVVAQEINELGALRRLYTNVPSTM